MPPARVLCEQRASGRREGGGHQLDPLLDGYREVTHLRLGGLPHGLDALLPQLLGPDAQLLGSPGLADLEGLLDVLLAGLELGLDGLPLPPEQLADGLGPLLLDLLDL